MTDTVPDWIQEVEDQADADLDAWSADDVSDDVDTPVPDWVDDDFTTDDSE